MKLNLNCSVKDLEGNTVIFAHPEKIEKAKDIIDYLKSNFKFNEDQFISSILNEYYKDIYDDFLDFISNPNIDGVVVTYPSTNPKNSFAIVENHHVTELVEKKAVTDIALIGVHYWKQGLDFIFSAKNLLNDFEEKGRPECYISESYNYLIKQGLRIKN